MNVGMFPLIFISFGPTFPKACSPDGSLEQMLSTERVLWANKDGY